MLCTLMKRIYCDMCKNEIKDKAYKIHILDWDKFDMRDVWEEYDLCKGCRERLEKELRE